MYYTLTPNTVCESRFTRFKLHPIQITVSNNNLNQEKNRLRSFYSYAHLYPLI